MMRATMAASERLSAWVTRSVSIAFVGDVYGAGEFFSQDLSGFTRDFYCGL